VGTSSAGRSTPDCGEAGPNGAKAKIEASTRVMERGLSCSWAIARRIGRRGCCMTRPSLALSLCKKLPDGQIMREGVKLSSQKYFA
jgi:hypothetical protein